MPFDTKKAVEAWKKAKPLMLTDTGVSDVLRSIPTNPTLKQLPLFKDVQKKLEGFMANPKIKAEKKALACIMAIHTDIGKYLLQIKLDRQHVAANMEKLLVPTMAFGKAVEKGPLTVDLASQFSDKLGPLRRGLSLDHKRQDDAAVPVDIFMDFNTGESGMRGASATFVDIAKDAARPTPTMDTKAATAMNIALYWRCWNLMDKAHKAVKAL